MVVVERGGYKFYIDGFLSRGLDKRKKILQKDDDVVYIVSGKTRAGKSVLAMQLAKYVDPTFNIKRVVYNYDEFKRVVLSCRKMQAIVFDEAKRATAAVGVMSTMNKAMDNLMQECGQRNLFLFLCLPQFQNMSKSLGQDRANGMFWVYRDRKTQKRGHWKFYSEKKKNKMYEMIRKSRNLYLPPTCKGRFTDTYVLDEQEYRKKKSKFLLEDDDKKDPKTKFQVQRDVLIYHMNKKIGLANREISEILKGYNVKLSMSGVHRIVDSVKKEKK